MSSIKEKLNEIDVLKSKLDSYRPLSGDQIKNLKNLFDIEFTFNSTAIEGNTFTLNETKIVLLNGITIGGKSTKEHLEIVNHREAINYIEQLADKKLEKINKFDILSIHNLILRGIDSENSGKYRSVPVFVKKQNEKILKFCEPTQINDLMDEFFHWLFQVKNEHPVIVAADAHTRLVTIHPFVDGNGRTARLLLNLILIQNGFPPAIILASKRLEYITAIENWQENNHKELFYNLLIQSVQESLNTYLETIEKKIIWK